jgi:hypothetical protein
MQESDFAQSVQSDERGILAASPFLVTSLSEISLLMVPPRTEDRVIRAFRAGGTKVERAQGLQKRLNGR